MLRIKEIRKEMSGKISGRDEMGINKILKNLLDSILINWVEPDILPQIRKFLQYAFKQMIWCNVIQSYSLSQRKKPIYLD